MPSELINGRQIRTDIDVLLPSPAHDVFLSVLYALSVESSDLFRGLRGHAPLKKKENDAIWCILKVFQNILKQIENINVPSNYEKSCDLLGEHN